MKKFSTLNSQLSTPLGFTLVELLLGVAIFAIIGTTILSILFITLRVSRKSDVLIELKQSGNTVMSQIVKQIRYAKSLDIPSDTLNCPVSTPPALSSIKITSNLDNAKTTFSCVAASPPTIPATIASNSASLVDTGSVEVSACSFTCTQPTLNDPPTIGINFTLRKLSSGLSESTGSVPFQSSVTMRNSSR